MQLFLLSSRNRVIHLFVLMTICGLVAAELVPINGTIINKFWKWFIEARSDLLRNIIIAFCQRPSCRRAVGCLLSLTGNKLCHLPLPWSGGWVIGGGCASAGLLTDLALSLVFVSKGQWETGSQTSTADIWPHLRPTRLDTHRYSSKLFSLFNQSLKPFGFLETSLRPKKWQREDVQEKIYLFKKIVQNVLDI